MDSKHPKISFLIVLKVDFNISTSESRGAPLLIPGAFQEREIAGSRICVMCVSGAIVVSLRHAATVHQCVSSGANEQNK